MTSAWIYVIQNRKLICLKYKTVNKLEIVWKIHCVWFPQCNCKKLPFVNFWWNIRGEHSQLHKRTTKIFTPFQLYIEFIWVLWTKTTIYIWVFKQNFYKYLKTADCNQLKIKASMSIHLSSIRPNIKEICKVIQ